MSQGDARAEKPTRPGWHWFLPDENCVTPTGLLRIDKPVVVLVGAAKYTRDGASGPLVVRFPNAVLRCDEMSGVWERIHEPKFMQEIARKRWTTAKGTP